MDLSNCSIRELKGSPFDELEDLTRLILLNNYLTDASFRTALRSHPKLRTIVLSGNLLNTFPNMGITSFPRLVNVYISHNNISSLSRENLHGMSKLEVLFIRENPLEGFPEEDDTLADCLELTLIDFDHTHITRLPNMTFVPKLERLYINHARLESLPEDLCLHCTDLIVLEAKSNNLMEVPTLSCKDLVDLDVGHNNLHTVHADLLKNMPHVRALDLRNNQIQHLDEHFFVQSLDMEFLYLGNNRLTSLPDLSGMPHLIRLNASHNALTRIERDTFAEQGIMDELYLNTNSIDYIDPLAFPMHNDLKLLNLSRNGGLREWVLPSNGFPNLAVLFLEEMFNLHQVPHTFEIPRTRELYLTYSYHCCIWDSYTGIENPNRTFLIDEDAEEGPIVTLPTGPTPTFPPDQTDPCELTEDNLAYWNLLYQGGVNVTVDRDTCEIKVMVNENVSANSMAEIGSMLSQMFTSRTGINVQFAYKSSVRCTPHEDPFTPCQFLLDPWVLKIAIWAVWVLALLGNGAVLFIGIAAKEKLESSELLICNLAFADFCMGVYLAFLAIVDIRTFGSSFFQSALDWQLGPGCRAAGFIAIFSSELSIYILVVLTLERVYTISSTFYHNEERKRRVVLFLCAIGWTLATVLALLPIFDINSYNKVAVCLPYLTERTLDKAYIGFILTINFVGFLVILFSYVYIFWTACRNAPPSNMAQRRKDRLVAASKIAVVIVTAFICWAPIAVIGYLAIFDVLLVDARQAKYFIVFVYPVNACVNPFIYAIFTKRFRSKFSTICRRSNDRVTSFPHNPHMIAQRTPSAFSSEYPMMTVGNRPDKLMKLRQSRRSSSLVVQMVDTNLSTPSPTSFKPPSGCNLGRRASLPAGFGSTLNMARGGADQSTAVPQYFPFQLSVHSDGSSLPNLKEESDSELLNEVFYSSDPTDPWANPLTSSQESNLRRLSVVREEYEGDLPSVCVDEKDENVSVSSSEEYSDASDSMENLGFDRGTDLDNIIVSTTDPEGDGATGVTVSEDDGESGSYYGKELVRVSGEEKSRRVLAEESVENGCQGGSAKHLEENGCQGDSAEHLEENDCLVSAEDIEKNCSISAEDRVEKNFSVPVDKRLRGGSCSPDSSLRILCRSKSHSCENIYIDNNNTMLTNKVNLLISGRRGFEEHEISHEGSDTKILSTSNLSTTKGDRGPTETDSYQSHPVKNNPSSPDLRPPCLRDSHDDTSEPADLLRVCEAPIGDEISSTHTNSSSHHSSDIHSKPTSSVLICTPTHDRNDTRRTTSAPPVQPRVYVETDV